MSNVPHCLVLANGKVRNVLARVGWIDVAVIEFNHIAHSHGESGRKHHCGPAFPCVDEDLRACGLVRIDAPVHHDLARSGQGQRLSRGCYPDHRRLCPDPRPR